MLKLPPVLQSISNQWLWHYNLWMYIKGDWIVFLNGSDTRSPIIQLYFQKIFVSRNILFPKENKESDEIFENISLFEWNPQINWLNVGQACVKVAKVIWYLSNWVREEVGSWTWMRERGVGSYAIPEVAQALLSVVPWCTGADSTQVCWIIN